MVISGGEHGKFVEIDVFFTAFLMVDGFGGALQICGNRWELLQRENV
jgi:hypothetical protein